MLVKVRVPRCHINPNAFYEDLLADDLREVCTPRFPKRSPAKPVPHTQPGGSSGGSVCYDVAVAEIRLQQPDGYENPHARKRTPEQCETTLYKGGLGGDCKSPMIGSPTERFRVEPSPEIRQWKWCQHPRKILLYCHIS